MEDSVASSTSSTLPSTAPTMTVHNGVSERTFEDKGMRGRRSRAKSQGRLSTAKAGHGCARAESLPVPGAVPRQGARCTAQPDTSLGIPRWAVRCRTRVQRWDRRPGRVLDRMHQLGQVTSGPALCSADA